MKASYYNFFFPYDEENKIAYNALTSALALISKENYESYLQFINNGIEISDEELKADLFQAGFLIDDEVDELKMIELSMMQSRFSTTSFALTIAPTNDCNFRCIYCYEKNALNCQSMTDEVQEQVVNMLKARVNTIKEFNVIWYGGEPLLAFDVVCNLTKKFQEICNQNHIRYHAGMVTNGYLLTSRVAEQLKGLGIESIQITLDGVPEIHNKRRPLSDGSPTFKTIWKNIEENYEVLPNISLRINIDKTNMKSGTSIIKMLKDKGLLDKIKPHFGQVFNENDTYESESCLNTCEFSNIDSEGQMMLHELNQEYELLRYPERMTHFCGADSISSFVVDAKGDLYKCWSEIGRSDACIGNIVTKEEKKNMVLEEYLLSRPMNNETCKKCKMLPICLGGCPFLRKHNSKENCSMYQYKLKDCLEAKIAHLLLQK